MLTFWEDIMSGVAPLTGPANYHQWRRSFELIARSKDLWPLILGDEPIVACSHPDRLRLYGNEGSCEGCRKWGPSPHQAHYDRVVAAMAWLRNLVSPNIRYKMMEVNCPAQFWKILEEEYKLDDDLAQAIALKSMRGLELTNCSGMKDYLDKFDYFKQDLDYAGGTITASQTVNYLHKGVVNSYSTSPASLEILDLLFTQAGLAKDPIKQANEAPNVERVKRLKGELLVFELDKKWKERMRLEAKNES
jgi:hypothetical protein